MELILLEYIENTKYGKVARFLKDDKEVFSKVIEKDDEIIYEELPLDEQEEFNSINIIDD